MIDMLRLFGPLTLWLASFSAVYGVQGIACAQGWSNAVVVSAWVLAVLLQAATLTVLWTDRFGAQGRFRQWVSRSLGVVALIAVIWTLSPAALLTACV